MDASDLTEYVRQLCLDVDALADARVREVVGKVLNLVERVVVENGRLQEEIQRLREIIRQLKGEPPSAAAPSRPPARDISSEKERRKHAPPAGGSPRADRRSFRDIRVDEESVCPVDAARLPPDAKLVGYEDVVVQDLQIKSHNIRYRLEIWDSPSQGRIRGELPPGVTGEYGPELKALGNRTKIIYQTCCGWTTMLHLGSVSERCRRCSKGRRAFFVRRTPPS